MSAATVAQAICATPRRVLSLGRACEDYTVRTLLIDCPFALPGADDYPFESLVSVFDYDLVMWDPIGSAERYVTPYQAEYRGRPSLSEAGSVAFVEDVARRRREFQEFVALGRTLVVFAAPPQTFWVDTGKKETSGTGRNQKVTRLVEERDLLKALPFSYQAVPGRGIELQLASAIAADLWRDTKDQWVYRCTLEEFPGEAILKVANVDKVVASAEIGATGGVVIILPEPWIPDEPEPDDSGEPIGENATIDQSDSEDDGDDLESPDRLAVPKAIHRWVVGLSLGDDQPLPDWCADLLLDSEIQRSAQVADVESSLAVLTEKLDRLKAAQAEDDQWKRLITSQGESLERQVRVAFEFLGFEVLMARRGRGDLRLNYGDQRVVVEIKGLAKSAGEKNAAQLEKWVAEELADGVHAKGILVVNGWRDRPLGDRDPIFPHQMLEYSIARRHCLVTGIQLLGMCLTVRKEESRRPKIAQALLETVGTIDGFDDPAELFSARPEVRIETT